MPFTNEICNVPLEEKVTTCEFHSMLLNFRKCYQDASLQLITKLLFLLVTKLLSYSSLNPWLMHYLKLTDTIVWDIIHSAISILSVVCTIFAKIDRYTIPAIHCLMTSKCQEVMLYCHCAKNLDLFHQTYNCYFRLESAPHNFFKEIYTTVIIHECWYHYTQYIWRKTHKIGLVNKLERILI